MDIRERDDLVSTVDAFIIQTRFYFISFHFIFGFSAVSVMRLYANRTSESGAGSGPAAVQNVDLSLARGSNARVYIRRRKLATTVHEIALRRSLSRHFLPPT